MRKLACVVLALFSAPTLAAAQRGSATLSGAVLVDKLRQPIENAVVAIPSLNRATSTDTSGRFTFADLKPGTHAVVVKRIGYSPHTERIAIAAGQTLELVVLMIQAQVLDSVVVKASRYLQSFEEHRAIGLGHFFTRAELPKFDGQRLNAVMSQAPGARIVPGRASHAWLSSKRAMVTSISNRRTCEGLDGQDAYNGARPCECYAQVYLDNHVMYKGTAIKGEPLFNLNSIPVADIEAIEYYAGPSQTPIEYSKLNSHCGVLVIHTRRDK